MKLEDIEALELALTDAPDWELNKVLPRAAPELLKLARRALEEQEVSTMVEKAMTHFYRVLSQKVEEKSERYKAALARLVSAAMPIDMWMGGLWANPPSFDERHEFVLALSAAMLLVQSGGTTSASQQTQEGPDDSEPSIHTKSKDPGNC